MAKKTFDKNSFTVCMKAFFDEIKTTHEKGEPEVVLFLYGKKDVKFNPQGVLKVGKDSVFVGVEKKEVKFKEIRGLDFYFKEDKKLEQKDEKALPLPKVDFTQYMNDRIQRMKENANSANTTMTDDAMVQYQNLLKSLQ